MNKENLDFEIVFFERLLEKKPDFAEALIALAENYTKKGWYEKGLAADMKLAILRPDDEIVYYNLACDYSLLKDSELCFEALEKAIELGYADFHHMLKDPDLEYIRQDKRYLQLLLGTVSKRRVLLKKRK